MPNLTCQPMRLAVSIIISGLLRCRPKFMFLTALFLMSHGVSMASAKDQLPLTVRDAIETTRFMKADIDGTRSIQISPDGRKYVAMLTRGDISRDGVEVEIIAGGLNSVDQATPYSVAKLFTHGLGSSMLEGEGNAPELLLLPTNFPQWIDNERVAFLWEDARGIRQVVVANVETRQWEFLTDSATDVTSFGVGAREALVYEAKRQYSLDRSNQLFQQGFVVKNPDAWSLLVGAVDGASAKDIVWGNGEKFVQVGSKPSRKLKVTGGGVNLYQPIWPLIRPMVSPDGRLAIVCGTPQDVPVTWRRFEGDGLKRVLREWESGTARDLQTMFVVSVDDATARPLWDAPLNPFRFASLRWAPDSRHIVAWPVYLPIGLDDKLGQVPNSNGLAGEAVAEIDVLTGRYTVLPVPREDVQRIKDIRWSQAGSVELQLDTEHVVFHKRANLWMESERDRHEQLAHVRVELRQGPNTPPALYAVDSRTAQERVVFDPNPRLRRDYLLGNVELIEWQESGGKKREARLFLPVGYKASQRYPLVIQTRGWGNRQDFTLYGKGSPNPTLGPSFSVYLAQPLANQGIAVLQLGPRPDGDGLPEAKGWMRAIESAIDHLSSIGVADRNRVGLMGHSRGGWHVGYTLAFSDYSFAAAITDDNIDSGYIESAMQGWVDTEGRNGARPFGVGLKDWLENAPGFNVEHIRAPLLMMVTDSFAGRATPIAKWEMFSRLRRLKKPVELWVAPNIERGSHNLQNPTQVLAQQERAMDWWRYWLKGERDSNEAKSEQYADWDKLRALHDEEERQPKPPRLRWTVETETR